MNRAERRARTERIVERRRRDWFAPWRGQVDPATWEGYRAGRSRKLHPFDCGRTQCGVCTHGPGSTPRDERLLAESRAEAEHPECWPERVWSEVDEIEYEVWAQDLYEGEARATLLARFRETFPLT